MRNIIENILYEKNYSWEETFNVIKNRQRVVFIDEGFDQVRDKKRLVIDEDEYPKKFQDIYMPPFIVYYLGNYRNIDSKQSIGLLGQFNSDEIDELIAFAKNKKRSISIIETDLTEEILTKCIQNGIYLTVICENNVENFKFKTQYKKLLLISETPFKDWDRSEEQTYERMLFAISDSIYVAENDITRLVSVGLNTKYKNKKFYAFQSFKFASESKIYLNNIESFKIIQSLNK